MEQKDLINLNQFELLEKVGHGNFGDVYRVKEKATGCIYAAKISKIIFEEDYISDSESIRNLIREVNIMSKLIHPSIVKLIGFSLTDFRGDPRPVIILEYIGQGRLTDFIKLERNSIANDKWNDTRKLITIYSIASAMKFLHENNIIHRDLKPDNILFDDEIYPKIADFGLSKILHYNRNSMSLQSTIGFKGTYMYSPPEIINDYDYSKAGDVYAFSLIVYEIITNEIPFKKYKDFKSFIKALTDGDRPEFDSLVPDCYKSLIERCWSQDPSSRMTFNEIVDELETNRDFITDMIDEDEYIDYIDYIKDYQVQFFKFKKIITIDQFKKIKVEKKKREEENNQESNIINKYQPNSPNNDEITSCKQEIQANEIALLNSQQDNEALHEPDNCQELVEADDTKGQNSFLLGKYHVEGKLPFVQNTSLGVEYLLNAIELGVKEATFYYSRMLIEGKLVSEDLELSRTLLSKSSIIEEPEALVLLGKIEYKKRNFKTAKDYFIKASNKGNGESMFLYASMLMKGEGVPADNDEALRYFTLAIKNGYNEKPPQINVQDKPEKVEKESTKSSKKKKEDKCHFIKFVIVGDSINNCKSTFLMVLNHKPFPERYVPSFYSDFSEEVEINGEKYKFWIYDTIAQDEYDGLRPFTYSRAHIIGLTFSMSSLYSFSNLSEKWIGEVKHYCKDAAIVLIGLCLDEFVEGNPNHVTIKQAQEFAKKMNFDGFIACSAKTGQNMDKVFPTLVNALKLKNKGNAACNIA